MPAEYRQDFWNSFKSNIFSEVKPLPWMNYKGIDHIKNVMAPNSLLFEYVSGSSTRYWISLGCTVVSVEHDKAFFQMMQSSLADLCDYKLIEPEINQDLKFKSHEIPEHYKSYDYDDRSFEAYVRAIDVYPDGHFDFVIVDGRARPSCIKHAIPKIKSGGFLVLDNSNRGYYLKNTKTLMSKWAETTHLGTVRGLLHKEQTSIFQKP